MVRWEAKRKGRRDPMEAEAPSLLLSREELWMSMFNTVCERIGSCFARGDDQGRGKSVPERIA
jgi:hypothetical protein